MAPSVPFLNLMHRLRTAHPLAPGMRRTLARLDRASAEEVRAFQERRLRLMVRWAAQRTSYYRDFFATSDLDPRDIRTLDDLTALPLLDRDDLVTDPDRFRAYPGRLTWTARSSGTSGSVVRVQRTPGSSAYELGVLQRQWSWFGVTPDARRLVSRAAGGTPADDAPLTVGLPGARQLLVSAYAYGRDDDRLLREVRAFEPDTVEGWPSALALLASILRERGERLPVRAVITSSEVMTAQQVRLLEEVYDAPVVDHYGQTERVSMAGTCEAGGFHQFPDYGITELLPVPGEPGEAERFEIVGTPLHNWGFPLLRYRTGDTVGPAPDQPCACGRSWPLLGPVAGRSEDSFTTAEGRVLLLPAVVVDDLEGLREVQVAQRAPGHFEVRVVPVPGTDLDGVRAHALRNVERYFGPGQRVDFAVLGRIPRPPSGKLKPAVIDPLD